MRRISFSNLFSVVLAAAFVFICAPARPARALSTGVFEEKQNQQIFNALVTQHSPKLPVESENVRYVLISGKILLAPHVRFDMVEAIVAAGAQVLITADTAVEGALILGGLKARGLADVKFANGTEKTRVIDISELVQSKNAWIDEQPDDRKNPWIRSSTLWTRDYAGFWATGSAGNTVWVDQNYYPVRPIDDSLPGYLSVKLDELKIVKTVYLSTRVANEGGNLDASLTSLFMSKQQNADMSPLEAAVISTVYKRAFNRSQVRIFPAMPYEGTGHVDMWMKSIRSGGGEVVFVNELRHIDMWKAAGLSSGFTKREMAQMQAYLDARAKQLQSQGSQVIRLPMPMPLRDIPKGAEKPRGFNLVRSYTNSLLVNGTALIPRYADDYPDSKFVKDYENAVERAYRAAGFKTIVWIPADTMIEIGGAVHCTTMQFAGRPF